MLNPRGNNFYQSEPLTAWGDCLSVDILYLEKSDNTNVCWTDITREPVWTAMLYCLCAAWVHSFSSLRKIQTFLVVTENWEDSLWPIRGLECKI